MRKYTKTDEANLIPCVGAQKIPQLASLLIGWDLEFLAVLDNDKEGRKIEKQLSEKLAIEDRKIVFVSDQDNNSIEDLFTRDDFNKFVLNDTKNEDESVSNSNFLKDKKPGKVLLAKSFFESVEFENVKMEDMSEAKLSQETINAFKKLFNNISNGFK